MSRRDQIRMTEEEQREFLENGYTAILTSISAAGLPHPVAMWYVTIDGLAHFATYAKSQKMANLRRNPASAVLVEEGKRYDELRGLLIQGPAEIRDDPELTLHIQRSLYQKYTLGSPGAELPPEAEEFVRKQAAKRSTVIVHPEKVATWDHRKLGGVY